MKNEVDIIRSSLRETHVHFKISPILWDRYNDEIRLITNGEWHEVKFLDDELNVNNELRNIPDDCGGIYSFIAKPDLIPSSHLYLLYIGRSKYTQHQNLRKRCKEYPREDRPKIEEMISIWGKFLYIRYLPLRGENDLIEKVESELVNAILPPCNDRIPDKNIRRAVAAFF